MAQRNLLLSIIEGDFSDIQVTNMLSNIIKASISSEVPVNYADILIGFLNTAVKKQYIVSDYIMKTDLPESAIMNYLNGLDDLEVGTIYNEVVAREANENYIISGAIVQTQSSRNNKIILYYETEVLPILTNEEMVRMYDVYVPTVSSTSLSDNKNILGIIDLDNPSSIIIYASDFANKEKIAKIITEYNNSQEDEADKIQYTDIVALLMSSVTDIINAISYVLIAFVSISLIVSSIMIGIITYISVLERTKEIGILRAVGASKRDVSRVFNAETMLVGFAAGLFGILVTLILSIPINLIIYQLSGISGVAKLPVLGAIILITISVILTLVSGLIPSGLASKKDPVEALRTE